MITIKQIRKYCQLKNIALKELWPNSGIKIVDNKYVFKLDSNPYHIGLELKPNIWYWFSAYYQNRTIEDNSELLFEQRHNLTNGAIIYSGSYGFKAEWLIINFLKKVGFLNLHDKKARIHPCSVLDFAYIGSLEFKNN